MATFKEFYDKLKAEGKIAPIKKNGTSISEYIDTLSEKERNELYEMFPTLKEAIEKSATDEEVLEKYTKIKEEQAAETTTEPQKGVSLKDYIDSLGKDERNQLFKEVPGLKKAAKTAEKPGTETTLEERIGSLDEEATKKVEAILPILEKIGNDLKDSSTRDEVLNSVINACIDGKKGPEKIG